MRLPERVIGAMKGIGGAALIAVAAAGCAASQPAMKPTVQAPVVLAHQSPPQPQPPPVEVVNPPQPPPPPFDLDMVACGRG